MIRPMTAMAFLLAGAMPMLLASAESHAFGLGHGQHEGAAQVCYRKAMEPARYAWVSRQVMMRPAWTEVVTTPPRYAVKRVRTVVTPARTVWHTEPARYRTASVSEVVRPARVEWVRKRTRKGEVLCKVSVPAEVRTVARRVLVAPARKVAVHEPAVYGVVEKRVMVSPARTTHVRHPAVYRTVQERVLVAPARVTWVQVAPGC